jgi:hypothetical protein
MTPRIRNHCPSSNHCCQRYTCTRELRNRLERRRSERDQLTAKLEADTASSMRPLRKLREDCNKPDQKYLSLAKEKYEDEVSKTVSRPKCFCAECAVEHKDREIASLRKNYQALETMQQVVAGVQRQRERRERGKATTP